MKNITKHLWKRISYFLMMTCFSLNTLSAYSKKPKPNIIFLFSDDQRFNSLSMTGDPVTKTPNIDL